MAQIILNIPNSELPAVADALAWAGGYTETLADGTPNPITKNQFAKNQIIVSVKRTLKKHQDYLALQTAQAEVDIT